MPLRSVITSLLMASGLPWWSLWAWGKEKIHTTLDQMNREIDPIRQCLSRPETIECLAQPVTLHFRYFLIKHPASWIPPAPGIIFPFLAPLFEPIGPLKNKCAWHGTISIHLLKYFKCLWQTFAQLDKRFQVYSLLGVHRSFFSAHRLNT